MRARSAVLALALLFVSGSVGAYELKSLYHGTRSMAMGGAFVGLADDEEAIFLNPAGMAGNTRYRLNYLSMDLAASGDVVTSASDSASAFRSLSGDSLNVIMGKDIYGEAQFAPSLMMPNFGIAVLVDGQAALLAKNQSLPQITVGDQVTNGVQVAYGVALGHKSGFAPLSRGELRVGVGVKMMWRRGGYKVLPVSSLLTIKDSFKGMIGNFGRGEGVDLGTQYVYPVNNRFTLMAGSAYTEIGDLNFGDGPDQQKGNLTIGVAAKYSVAHSSVTLLYDYGHILAQTDWRRRNHLGVECSIPFISLYGGVNQTDLTYGASLDLWLLKLTAVSYAEEEGNFAFIDTERRYILNLALKFDL